MPPTIKYWNSLFFPGLTDEAYFPKSGMLLALLPPVLKGLLYEVHAALSLRTAVVLRARTGAAVEDDEVARRHAREALVRAAIAWDLG
jgi:hypothetical protein